MSDLDATALKLAGFTLAFLIVLLGAWWMRRPKPEPAAPKAPRLPRESRLPKLVRRADPEPEPVEIAPSRLARISAKPTFERLSETHETDEPAPETPPTARQAGIEPAPLAIDEAILAGLAATVERQAHGIDPIADSNSVRLVPQIPPRDAILCKNWLGGRPRLPAAMEWPKVDGVDGDFLAQIACADLPAGLWDGLGPRSGSLAVFANPDSGAVMALHVADAGVPRDPPRAAGAAYFRAWGEGAADLAPLLIRAFPEWPVDIIVGAAGDDAADERTEAEALLAADYDLADPAFHPFDWDSLLAMAAILESRLSRLPTDGIAPDDASDELAEAIADAAETNREAVVRAAEIIAIIRESAAQGGPFSPPDATAVMAALHAIRWTSVGTTPDPESGEDRVETLTLPLTRHHPADDLWVDAWRSLLFDHAKHRWCRNPDALSAPARAFFEPVWAGLAASEAVTLGHFPSRHAAGFDDERDTVLLELPASGLMSRAPRGGGPLVLAIRKSDLAAGDFSKLRALTSN